MKTKPNRTTRQQDAKFLALRAAEAFNDWKAGDICLSYDMRSVTTIATVKGDTVTLSNGDTMHRSKVRRVQSTAKMFNIGYLNDLQNRAVSAPAYAVLAILGAQNLGGHPVTNLEQAMRWLHTSAMESGSEQGVVDEVNFCIELAEKAVAHV